MSTTREKKVVQVGESSVGPVNLVVALAPGKRSFSTFSSVVGEAARARAGPARTRSLNLAGTLRSRPHSQCDSLLLTRGHARQSNILRYTRGAGQEMLEAASAEHVRASIQALENVASAVNVPRNDLESPYLNVQICHFQHNGFLNPRLHGFPALAFHSLGSKPIEKVPILSELSVDQLIDLSEGWANAEDISDIQSRKTAYFVDLKVGSTSQPARLMASLNDSVNVQISASLSNISSLLGRQKLIAPGATEIDISTLPDEANVADQASREQVSDLERAAGWRAVATQLREQSIAQGTPIKLSYSGPAFSAAEVANRAPVMRYIYNRFPRVRLAVDKVVASISRSMHVGGDAPGEILRFGQELMDRMSIKTFLAHQTRDAFVCGNGVLSFGENPLTDTRLIRPETIIEVRDSNEVCVSNGESSTWLANCIHLRGSDQIGSQVGLSYLEPFVLSAIQRCIWIESLLTARAWGSSAKTPLIPSIQSHIRDTPPLALRQLAAGEQSTIEVLGTVTEGLPDPPTDLYFKDLAIMQPSARNVSIFVASSK